jgi:hypothetical protein
MGAAELRMAAGDTNMAQSARQRCRLNGLWLPLSTLLLTVLQRKCAGSHATPPVIVMNE